MEWRNPLLEAELRDDPTEWSRWLVYADWLAERGDPRAEIVTLGHELLTGELGPGDRRSKSRRYGTLWRSLRWPDDHPRPPTDWRARFEAMFEELRDTPNLTVERAVLGPPTHPDTLAHWRAVAGPAWPDGMEALYRQLSRVDLVWRVLGDRADEDFDGRIRIPDLAGVWDYSRLEGDLWFPDAPRFRDLRPIDRFAPEACAVLHPVPPPSEPPATAPARVAYHYRGKELVPTSLTYVDWLEFLLRSRGVVHALTIQLGRVQDAFWPAAKVFPEFPWQPPG